MLLLRKLFGLIEICGCQKKKKFKDGLLLILVIFNFWKIEFFFVFLLRIGTSFELRCKHESIQFCFFFVTTLFFHNRINPFKTFIFMFGMSFLLDLTGRLCARNISCGFIGHRLLCPSCKCILAFLISLTAAAICFHSLLDLIPKQ